MHHVEVGAIIHLSPSFFYPPGRRISTSLLLEEPKNGEEYSRDIGVVPARVFEPAGHATLPVLPQPSCAAPAP